MNLLLPSSGVGFMFTVLALWCLVCAALIAGQAYRVRRWEKEQ